MRLTLNKSLGFEGVWSEESDDPLKTSIRYHLFTYHQLIKYRNGTLDIEDIAQNILEISNVELGNKITDLVCFEDILNFMTKIDAREYNMILEEMISDSFLSVEEFRRLEFIVYYLNWKADELTRRQSYNCDECRKFNYLENRYCYLESQSFELPIVSVDIKDDGSKELVFQDENEDVDEGRYLTMLNDIMQVSRGSIFDLALKYFGRLLDDSGKYVEVCPEAIKVHSENVAELFEMEARCSEYGLFPFDGGQLSQPAILIESFDAIRTGRNTFHSKKMEEVTAKKKPAAVGKKVK